MKIVAPVRERGLKLKSAFYVAVSMASRSREGAWIEILSISYYYFREPASLP